MLLSKTCEYAIRTALYVAATEPTAYTAVREIADALGIPYPFLAKIAQTLTQAGLLQTLRGPHGGIALARPATRITLEEVVLATDGPAIFRECVLGLPGCGDRKPCPLHDQWVPARERIHAMFATATLSEVAANIRAHNLRLVFERGGEWPAAVRRTRESCGEVKRKAARTILG